MSEELEELKQKYLELQKAHDELLKHATIRTFHGYTILSSGKILSKKGTEMKVELRERNGGGVDETVRMYIGGKLQKFTVQRLIAASFQGPIFGYEINHKDRDTRHNNNVNLDRTTASENQQHWRADARERKMI